MGYPFQLESAETYFKMAKSMPNSMGSITLNFSNKVVVMVLSEN